MYHYDSHLHINKKARLRPDEQPRPRPPARVLFLDFDGVIITPRSHIAQGAIGGRMIEPDAVAMSAIRKVCDKGVRIVVSSTWRLREERCKAFLAEHELLPYLHSDWCTPDTSRDAGGGVYVGAPRGAEIAAWLAKHPEVVSYRILDDDPSMMPAQMPYFIQCESHDGVSYAGVKNLFEWVGIIGEPKEAA